MSKDQAYGPVAAHVFEEPGTYEVRLTVRDAKNRESSATINVTVTDPKDVFAGDNTICLSSSGNFDGCPDKAVTVRANDIRDAQSKLRSNRRLLLRRGDSFKVTGNGLNLKAPGPGLVGAYGQGPAPVVSPEDNAFAVFGDDWRIIDIDIDGKGLENSRSVSTSGEATTPRSLLMLRVRSKGTGRGVYLHGSGSIIQDSEIREIVGGKGANILWLVAERSAVLGTRLYNSNRGEHVARIPEARKVVFSNNVLGEAPSPRHVLKLHAPPWHDGNRYTEKVIISDNIIQGTGTHGWSVAIGPQNEKLDQRLRDILVERNYMVAGPKTNKLLHLGGEHITVRSNIFQRKEGIEAAIVIQRGIAPPPANVSFINNTVYTEESYAALVNVVGPMAGFKSFNNLVISPGTPHVAKYNGKWLGTDSRLGNVAASTALFAKTPPQVWQDFRPTPGAPGLGVGIDAQAIFWDFDRRPLSSPPTPGALQPVQGAAKGASP